jgi:hypothetical protein
MFGKNYLGSSGLLAVAAPLVAPRGRARVGGGARAVGLRRGGGGRGGSTTLDRGALLHEGFA